MVHRFVDTASYPRSGARHGHISRNCPTAPEGGAGGQAGGAGGRSCYNCGEVGHLSRDCTSEPMQQDGDFGARRRGSRPKCYNCGDFGHISRECPQKDAGPKCYNCGNFGHISGACSEPARAQEEGQMEYDASAGGALADQAE
ncbi:Cellular nucleic acid-binding protein-like [Hondaea fermentalgiana]|uniref:Cellular nucleic acid-binding protein-like n=1 Tax=Hondaea fermentalgiana TaxID=2315210 RepID=A0A2R5G6M9_9STRA|nr:Cellular nucleic acid-binding protein-like [Hondaea fermentalgiana]|eukprot:GBG26707.1 Cellular nucleic acid-binding protein-like [Hondaea fermentalgiana]